MIALVALATFSISAPAWIVRTQTNLLGQPENVAELPETPDAPGQFLKFSCSVMSGPVFEMGLGPRSFEEFSRFSADDAASDQPVALTIQGTGPLLSVTASPLATQVTAHAFAIGGGEAVAAAHAIAASETATIAAPDARAQFQTTGAAPAIGRVLDACPFKG